MYLYISAYYNKHLIGFDTVIINASLRSDVVIPCGNLDPPYTYHSFTKSGAVIVAENSLDLYKVNNIKRSHNGDEYCCYSIKSSDTHCYQLYVACKLGILGISNMSNICIYNYVLYVQ